MVFFFTLCVLSWIWFIGFADKTKFRLYFPTCLLAMYLASTVDFYAHHYGLWNYPAPTDRQTYWYHLSQQLGIYPIVVYFFLQWLPKNRSWTILFRYIFLWTLFAIFLEWAAIKTGSMEHKKWWSFAHSYTADWILYLIFYWNHKWWAKSKQLENTS